MEVPTSRFALSSSASCAWITIPSGFSAAANISRSSKLVTSNTTTHQRAINRTKPSESYELKLGSVNDVVNEHAAMWCVQITLYCTRSGNTASQAQVNKAFILLPRTHPAQTKNKHCPHPLQFASSPARNHSSSSIVF